MRNFNKFVVYFAGFSLMNWFTTTGYSDSSPLTGDALDDLEEILGIVQLYDMDMCMQSNVSSNGWNNGIFTSRLIL